MSDNNLILSDAEAEAAKELLKTAQGFGGFVRDILGTVPEDLIGLLGGDWLKVRRFENILRTIKKAHDRLEKDGIKPEAASLSVSLPILRAAADESREELQDLWADLLAASADPARSRSFRNEFIEIIKDPIFRTQQVIHDFDYPGVEKLSRDEARKRFMGRTVGAIL